MKKTLALILLPFFALAGCDSVKVDEEGQKLDKFLSNYSIKISSNSDKLYFSADIDTSTFLSSSESKLFKPECFINSAHYDFASHQDIEKPESWYFQNSNEPGAMKHTLTSFELVNGDRTYYYLQKIDFQMKIEEEELHEYDVSLDSIIFPEVNVFSLVFAGNRGYQERLSDGEQIGGDEIISHVSSNVVSKISFYVYLNGNDPLVTNENLEYLNNNLKGTFEINIKVTQN